MNYVTADLTISLDGFVAGPRQSLEHPMGEGTERLHRWQFEQAEENAAEIAAIVEAGAFIMGRNMFGPIRGEWEGDWQGWWDENPPYHAPVYVLTHYPREPLVMQGGTTFYFVTDGVESAMEQARTAAGSASISIGGGADTIRQFLNAGLIDELSLHTSPILLGEGERLFDGVSALALEPLSARSTSLVTHVRYRVTYAR
ncbi:MAG: dihydrofolate reductase family protein [Lacisediminihabitans sp.]